MVNCPALGGKSTIPFRDICTLGKFISIAGNNPNPKLESLPSWYHSSHPERRTRLQTNSPLLSVRIRIRGHVAMTGRDIRPRPRESSPKGMFRLRLFPTTFLCRLPSSPVPCPFRGSSAGLPRTQGDIPRHLVKQCATMSLESRHPGSSWL